jgi:hypothetical protein
MKRKNVKAIRLFCLLIILSVSTLCGLASTINSGSYTGSISIEETEKLYDEFLKLKETTLKQRSELIGKLMEIIKEPKYHINLPLVFSAMDILCDIRATEAIDTLLDMADFPGMPSTTPRRPLGDTTKPEEAGKNHPAVTALIKIHPPYQSVLKRIPGEQNVIKRTCYVAILIGIEGPDISRYLIEKAIEKETDKTKLAQLNSALNMLNKDYPKENNDVKQK